MTREEMKALKIGETVYDVYRRREMKVVKHTFMSVHLTDSGGTDHVRKYKYHNLLSRREEMRRDTTEI